MGADGGIRISKISDIKKDWFKIKSSLINRFEFCVRTKENYESEYYIEYLDKSKKLPDNIDNLSNKDIKNLFNYLSSCDCPYLYEDSIITGEGDNVEDQMNTLSEILPGISIETWT